MFLLNKVTPSRRHSRELTNEDRADINLDLDYALMVSPNSDIKQPRERRQSISRMRSSFFGPKRPESLEMVVNETDEVKSPSKMSTASADKDNSSFNFGRIRRIRKASSKASLFSTAASEMIPENPLEERAMTPERPTTSRWRAGSWAGQAPLTQRKFAYSISHPYNFSHLTHANSRDVNLLRATDQTELAQNWNNAIRDSSQLAIHRETKNDVVVVTPTNTTRERSASMTSRPRAGSNKSNKSISPNDSFTELPVTRTEDFRYACPLTPPPRMSSRHCLRSLEESPREDEAHDSGEYGGNCSSPVLFVTGDDAFPCAVTTVGDSCYGEKSPSIDKPMEKLCGEASGNTESNGSGTDDTASIPELRETQSTPDNEPVFSLQRHSFLMPRPRPMSQLSQLSDTLHGNFNVASSTFSRGKRMSCRYSSQLRGCSETGALDSWEEDIDWCYEHEADASCNFDWDEGSNYSTSVFGEEEETIVNTRIDLNHTPASLESATLKPENFRLPPFRPSTATSKDDFMLVEKRITGIFEDKLILPPSPQFPPPNFMSAADAKIEIADVGFNICKDDEEWIMFRAADTALRHRSISSAASLPDLVPGKPYRDEHARVAKQIDDHIAALNEDACLSPVKRDDSLQRLSTSRSFLRARANSETTCVTMCSDTDTITPTETAEIITPSGSAHNSIHFSSKPRSSSVVGVRAEKGLSFPAAAIPGVIEFGPDDGVHNLSPEEQEFVHYI